MFQHDPETKRQTMHWKTPSSPRMKKARQNKSKLKAMLVVFFDIKGVRQKLISSMPSTSGKGDCNNILVQMGSIPNGTSSKFVIHTNRGKAGHDRSRVLAESIRARQGKIKYNNCSFVAALSLREGPRNINHGKNQDVFGKFDSEFLF
ncbi:uncharacterized protein [Macrobrachium rosenbergii]|uniref:uncharacterized protein n=1 Tax=Macrobrachium rosenbergii TaxID=79674 RepID=UPI0034D6226F